MSTPITVRLTASEILIAAQAGLLRTLENLVHDQPASHGGNESCRWQIAIEGALGEWALAKYLRAFWPGKGVPGAPDVGTVDVRTAPEDHHRLILHDTDPDERIFYLLCGRHGTYTVKGWLRAKDGKKPEYRQDPTGHRPAYFIPQEILHPPQEKPLDLP